MATGCGLLSNDLTCILKKVISMGIKMSGTGLLILRDGVISLYQPQIASDRTIHEKSHNSQKNTQNS